MMQGSERLSNFNFYNSMNCQPLTFKGYENRKTSIQNEEEILSRPMQSKEPYLSEEPPVLSYYA